MNKTVIILGIITFVVVNCGDTPKKHDNNNNTEKTMILESKEKPIVNDGYSFDSEDISKKQDNDSTAEKTVTFENEDKLIDNDGYSFDSDNYSGDFGNKQNPFYGKVYMNIKDILELKHWKELGGAVVDNRKDARFGIGYYENENGEIVCTFDEFSQQRDEKGRVRFKILDIVNIGMLKNNEYFTLQTCKRDTIQDIEIIAIVIADHDKEYYDIIVKAWRANRKTGRIEPIENIDGITCMNVGYGV